MKWKLVITPKVQEIIRTLAPKTKQYVRQALLEINRNPSAGKPLRDELAGLYSFRVRRFRIVYEIRHRVVTVIVIGIGRRETIYEELFP